MSLLNLEKEQYNEKMISKLIGSKAMGELEALQFLAKHFRLNLPYDWRKFAEDKILIKQSETLFESYGIQPTRRKDTNFFSRFLSKIKFKKQKNSDPLPLNSKRV
jgi:hypothetical protein